MFEKTKNKRKRGRGWPIFKKKKFSLLPMQRLKSSSACLYLAGNETSSKVHLLIDKLQPVASIITKSTPFGMLKQSDRALARKR